MRTFLKIVLSLFFVICFLNSWSQTYSWTNTAGSTSPDYALAIATDSAGNVYVAGSFQLTVDFDPGPAVWSYSSAGNTDIFIAKYRGTGELCWVRKFGTGGIDDGMGIATDSLCNVYFCGRFTGTIDFDLGPGFDSLVSVGNRDVFFAKFDSSGNHIWANSIGSSSYDDAENIAVDPSGYVYVTGSITGNADFNPGAGIFNLGTAGGDDMYVGKYNGTDGSFIWAFKNGASGGDDGLCISFAGTQEFYLTGSFSSTCDFEPGAGATNLTSAGSYDGFLAKYDTAGNFIWAQGYGSTGFEFSYDVKVSPAGDVYTCGFFSSSAEFNPTGTSYILSSAGMYDAFIAKFSPSGSLIWAKRFGGASTDYSNALAFLPNGNLLLASSLAGVSDIDPGPDTVTVTSLGNTDIVYIELDTSGTYVGHTQLGAINEDHPNDLAAGPDGCIHSTGYFSNSFDFDFTTGIDIGTSNGGFDAFVSKFCYCSMHNVFISTEPNCFGGSDGELQAVITGGGLPLNITWSTGDTTQTISNITAGTYLVTVIDSSNCVVVDSVTLSQPNVLSSAIQIITTDYCLSDSLGSLMATIAGGTLPYSIDWNNGDTLPFISGLSAGLYVIAILDSNGCSLTDSVALPLSPPMAVAITFASPICADDSSGFALALANSGFAPFAYSWSNGDTDTLADNLSEGEYFLTVTDSNGCLLLDSVSLVDPLGMTDSIVFVNPTCAGITDGSALINVLGGNLPYNYLWSNGDIDSLAGNLSAGTYYVTVSDSLGCQQTDSVILVSGALLLANYSLSNPICVNDSNGYALASLSGGVQPISYQWNNGDTDSLAENLSAGTYIVLISDSNGCQITDTITLLTSSNINASAIIINSPSCFGQSNGSITATASNGVLPYFYLWNNGDTSASINGIPAGTYIVDVHDSLLCATKDTITLTQPSELIAIIDILDSPECPESTNGHLKVNVTGGTLPYSFVWLGSTANGSEAIGLDTGVYSVNITDANGCTAERNASFENTQNIQLSLTGNNIYCGGLAELKASTDLPDNSIVQWLWSNGSTTLNTKAQFPGWYSVKLLSDKGCTRTDSILVEEYGLKFNYDSVINIITADGDGINDFFYPLKNMFYSETSIATNLKSYQIRIYSRWGLPVFESTDYNIAWDGDAGENPGDAIYYYELQFVPECDENEVVQKRHGFVHVLNK